MVAGVQARVQVRADRKALMMGRAERFLEEVFVRSRIVPLLPELSRRAPDWSGEVVRLKGTGRITLRYDFVGGATVYAKAYTDGLGALSYAALSSLWDDGFGASSLWRVPEPLGFHEDENFLLMRAVEGVSLADMIFVKSVEEVAEGARKAARWLARLHRAEVPCADDEAQCERIKIFKLGDMLAKASAAYPEQLPLLLDLLQRIREFAPDAETTPALAPTHGQYTPANVFLKGEDASVIDLDRICLSDPSKDVAIFIHRIRSIMFKAAGDTRSAERIADAFLEEYDKNASGNLGNLAYYTALYSLKGFAKTAKDRGPDDPARKPLEDFYLSQFARYMKGCGPSRAPDVKRGNGNGRAARPVRVGGGTKEELGRWAVNITASDFIGSHVLPVVKTGPTVEPASIPCETTVVQNTGTGRLTLRYDFEGGHVVFAKLYTDWLGKHSHRVLQALWAGGFNAGGRFRVSEPLAFLPEHNLVLMRGVPGEPLAVLLGKKEHEAQLLDGMRESARWLAALHRAPVRIGEPEPDWDSLKIFRICVRLTKAAAARPGEKSRLLDLMHALKERVRNVPARRPLAQTHGRYHHEHVFLSPEAASVIDFDRSRPTDPAKDVAEFMRVFRMAAYKLGEPVARIDRATDRFLDEYLARVPETAGAISFYWSAFLWLSYFGYVRKHKDDEERRRKLLDFHLSEMERVSEMAI